MVNCTVKTVEKQVERVVKEIVQEKKYILELDQYEAEALVNLCGKICGTSKVRVVTKDIYDKLRRCGIPSFPDALKFTPDTYGGVVNISDNF
jgi:hypothetical protein